MPFFFFFGNKKANTSEEPPTVPYDRLLENFHANCAKLH